MPIRYPLVSQDYQSRSLAAAASESTNLYAEITENKDDQSKNIAVMFLAPGRHLFKDLDFSLGNCRGLWSGGGRLFVAQGFDLVELNDIAGIVNRWTYNTADDGFPVQMFGNGNQLLLISTGQAFISNGGAPVKCRFLLEGTVSIAGTAVTWISGDQFPTYTPSTGDPLPDAIIINGNPVGVASWTDATHMVLSVAIAGGSGLVTYYPASGDVFWSSGTLFDPSWVGLPIVIGGITYTIGVFINTGRIQTVETPGGSPLFGQTYTVSIANNQYATAGGDLVTAVTGAYLDGSFYVQRPAGGSPDLGRQVNFSDVNDGTSWRPLNFFTKEGAPDYIRGIWVDAEVLYLFGTETAEAWQNDPNTGLPVRIPGAMQKFGSISPWGCTSIGGKVYFVGGDAEGEVVAYRIDGPIPTRISNHACEEQWKKFGLGDNCVSYTYLEDGHVFWVINFGSQAWAWDETEKQWARRMDWNDPPWSETAGYITQYHTFITEWGLNGTHITTGATLNAKVYTSSSSFYDDDGQDIGWRRAIPYRYNGGNQIFYGRQTLEMQTGTVPSGAAPLITRDYSSDRGQTFINPQTASIGIHGDYTIRVFWPAGGSDRGRVWRYSGYGQYLVALIDLQAEEVQGIV